MKEKLTKMSLRMQLTILTMVSLIALSGILLYVVNHNMVIRIIGVEEPINMIITSAVEVSEKEAHSIDMSIQQPKAAFRDVLTEENPISFDWRPIRDIQAPMEHNTVLPDNRLTVSEVASIKMKQQPYRKRWGKKESFYVTATNMPFDTVPIAKKISFTLGTTANDIKQFSYVLFFILILCGGIWVYFWCGKILRPVEQLAAEMEKRTVDTLNQPIKLTHTAAELQTLSHAFNQMQQSLEQSFAVQKQFNANAAHELRTPIAILRANIEAMEEEEISMADYQHFFTVVKRTTERMYKMVEVLLQMTKLEMVERTERVDLNRILQRVCEEASGLAEKKEVRINPCYSKDCLYVLGNEALLYAAIYNLLENGIKYNREGGSVYLLLEKEGAQAVLTIEDTGMGIAKTQQEAIFQAFYRIDESRGREYGGVGLGLCLVKSTVSYHQGTIHVDSAIGKGSRFIVRLPLLERQ